MSEKIKAETNECYVAVLQVSEFHAKHKAIVRVMHINVDGGYDFHVLTFDLEGTNFIYYSDNIKYIELVSKIDLEYTDESEELSNCSNVFCDHYVKSKCDKNKERGVLNEHRPN